MLSASQIWVVLDLQYLLVGLVSGSYFLLYIVNNETNKAVHISLEQASPGILLVY